MSKVIDLTGMRFGRLTVLGRAENRDRKRAMWLCKCDCGDEKIVWGYSLRSGRTVSCGCYNRDKCIRQHTTHGLSSTRIYNIWTGMKDRCINKSNPRWRHYGESGVEVCNEWREDFKAFYDWAVSHGYRDDLTIERIDVRKGYSPDNCRWATWAEQAGNKNNSTAVTINGETHTVAEWARIAGVSYNYLYKKYASFARVACPALGCDPADILEGGN